MTPTTTVTAPAPVPDWGDRDGRWAGIRSDTITVAGHAISLLRIDPAGPGDRSGDEGNDPGATPDDPEALPILLVHGLGGAATNWLDVMAPLAAQVHRSVVAVDLPGFGHSEPPDTRAARIPAQEHFLPRLLDALGWDRAEVHGNSMGGLLAALLAGGHPDRVGRLVLVSPALLPPVPRDRDALGSLDRQVLTQFAPFLVSWRLGAAAIRRLYATTPPEDVYAGTEHLVMGSNGPMRPAMRTVGIEQAAASQERPWRVESLARASNSLLSTYLTDRTRIHDTVAAIRAPVLVLWGTADRLVGAGVIDDLAERRPDVRRVDLDGVGHVAMIEVPDRYCDLVATWRGESVAPS